MRHNITPEGPPASPFILNEARSSVELPANTDTAPHVVASWSMFSTALEAGGVEGPELIPILTDPLVSNATDAVAQTLLHTHSDVVPLPANPEHHYANRDEGPSYDRFVKNYPQIAESTAQRVGDMTLNLMTQHADTWPALYDVYRIVTPL
jgi:hypothetical protein